MADPWQANRRSVLMARFRDHWKAIAATANGKTVEEQPFSTIIPLDAGCLFFCIRGYCLVLAL